MSVGHGSHVLTFISTKHFWYRSEGTGWEYSSRQEGESWHAIIPAVSLGQRISMYELHKMMMDCKYGRVPWKWESPEDCSCSEFKIKDTCSIQNVFLLLCLSDLHLFSKWLQRIYIMDILLSQYSL
jgi:hypothetical protein